MFLGIGNSLTPCTFNVALVLNAKLVLHRIAVHSPLSVFHFHYILIITKTRCSQLSSIQVSQFGIRPIEMAWHACNLEDCKNPIVEYLHKLSSQNMQPHRTMQLQLLNAFILCLEITKYLQERLKMGG